MPPRGVRSDPFMAEAPERRMETACVPGESLALSSGGPNCQFNDPAFSSCSMTGTGSAEGIDTLAR